MPENRKYLEDPKNGPFLDVFVSGDQGLKCIDMEVSTPSRLASVAWICISCGVTQRARQSSEFATEIEGTDTVCVNGGTAVGQDQPEIRIRASGDRLRFILKARRHHHPTDCT